MSSRPWTHSRYLSLSMEANGGEHGGLWFGGEHRGVWRRMEAFGGEHGGVWWRTWLWRRTWRRAEENIEVFGGERSFGVTLEFISVSTAVLDSMGSHSETKTLAMVAKNLSQQSWYGSV